MHDRTLVGDSVGLTHCSVSANFFISKPFMAHSFRCVSPSADTHMCVYLKSAGCSSCDATHHGIGGKQPGAKRVRHAQKLHLCAVR